MNLGMIQMQKSIAKNIFYKITLNFFNLVIPIIIGPYVYRTLGTDSIGSVKFAETIFNYFFIFASFGIYQYGIREISKVKNDPEKVSSLFTSLFVISFSTSILTFFAFLLTTYLNYQNHFIFPILLIFSLNFIFNIFFIEWLNEAYENYDFITIKTIIVKFIYIACLFYFVQSSDHYLEFTALLVMTNFLNNIISFIYMKRKVPFNFKSITIRPHLKPLFLVVIFSNANILYTQLDRFMLGHYINEQSVSFYVMSHQIMTIINAVLISIIQVAIPRLSFYSHENQESYLKLLKQISSAYLFILFPATIGMYVLSDIGVIVYGGSQFAEAGPVLAVFSFFMISIGLESILSNQVIYVNNKEKVLVYFIFSCGIINLMLNSILLYFDQFTAETAIMTTTIANFLLVALEYFYVRLKLKIKFQLFSLANIKYFLISLTFIPIAYIVKTSSFNIFIEFFLIIFICSAFYFLILFIMKDHILTMMFNKVKQRFVK